MNAQNIQNNFTSSPQSILPTTQDPRICATDDESIAPRQPKKSKQSLDYMVRSALAGGAAGCAAKTLIAPLDRIKILFQASSPQYAKYTGSWFGFVSAAGKIYGEDGVFGLFRGHSMTLLRIFPYAAIKFVAYEQFRAALIKNKDQETSWRRTLSGSAAGVTSVFFTYPLEVARVRLAFETRKGYHANIFTIFKQLYNEHPAPAVTSSSTSTTSQRRVRPSGGIANFYRGFLPTILGMLPYAGTSFLAHDLMGDWLRSPRFAPYAVIPNSGTTSSFATVNDSKDTTYSRSSRPQLKVWAELFAGGFAGLMSQTASYPLEVIRRRMQVGGAVGEGKFLSIRETATQIFREKGVRGFYVGLTIGYIKVVPMVATSFFVYERCKVYLGI